MKVTLHDVAAEAKVSIATASRTLNGLAVSPDSARRVRTAVARLGYVANEAARALRRDRTLTVGLIFFDLNNTLGVALIDAVSAAIEAEGYSLLIASARGDPSRYDLLMRRFLERRVDGLFCIDGRGEADSVADYAAANVPVIALFRATAAFASLPLLTPSFSECATALAEHLLHFGHQRVAVVADHLRTPPLAAVAEALGSGGADVRWITPTETGGMRQALDSAVAPSPRPTALIAHEPQARGLLSAARASQLKAPDDVSIVGISEIAIDKRRGRRSGLSALVVDPNRMGRAAGDAMLAWLGGQRPPDRARVQAGVFTPRASSGRAPAVVRLAS